MALINRLRDWIVKHVSVLGSRPANGKHSLEEMDRLLVGIRRDRTRICDTVKRLVADTDEVRLKWERENGADTSSH